MTDPADGSTWPIAVLTSAFCPDFEPQGLAMAMCVGYFEGWRNTGQPEVFTVSGYVSSKARWREFETRWTRALRRESIAAFNADDLARGTGEFAAGWTDDARRHGLIDALAKLTQQNVFHAFSYSVRLDEYDAINAEYAFREMAAGPYGIAAALAMANVRRWMAAKHPNDLTLFVFEQGDLEQRELQTILRAELAEQGEPAQIWPRRWIDERGRHRYLRPLEACDLLAVGSSNAFATRLLERSQFDRQTVDHDHLRRLCQALQIARRPGTQLAETRAGTR